MIAHLIDRAVIAVDGEGARPFLHNLLTQDVESLAPGEMRYAALLTPQGRLLHDMLLLGTESGVLIDVAASARDDLVRRLTLYRLRVKVTIAADSMQVYARLPSPPSGGAGGGGLSPPRDSSLQPPPTPTPPLEGEGLWMWDPRLPGLGERLLSAAPQQHDATPDAYDAHRVALGVPDAARDGLHDRAYPIEANLDLLHGIDFKKGCFVGQETTSRMHRRGTVKTRLLPLSVEGATAGAEVLAGTLRAGEVTYAREEIALALLRLDRLVGAVLTVDRRPAGVLTPVWFPVAA
jgi:hypothetical protein